MAAAMCMCGAWITVVDLPDDLARHHGKRRLWVHADGDDRCYPEAAEGDGGECKATPDPYADTTESHGGAS